MYFKEASQALIYILKQWGIIHLFGVTGGGVLEITKYLKAYHPESLNVSLFTMSEYAAGFAPIGHYLGQEEIAASISVSGAGARLITCGLSDAKILRIPILCIIGLNHSEYESCTPLQDAGVHGMNLVKQLRAELGKDVYHIQNLDKFEEQMKKVAITLAKGRPAVICFHPNIIKQPITLKHIPVLKKQLRFDKSRLHDCSESLNQAIIEGKNIYLYVCSEIGFTKADYPLVKELQHRLNARVICTVNGANACVGLPNFYGHIGLGGHKEVNMLWRNLGKNDILIALGIEAGDYHFLNKVSQVKHAFIFSNQTDSYGFINASYQHRFENACTMLKGPISSQLQYLLKFPLMRCLDKRLPPLCEFKTQLCANDRVDLYMFFKRLHEILKPNTICFDDVCASYRDRQFVMNEPKAGIRFYSSQDSSAMGGAFGFLLGAKIANPKQHCFAFIGDGCWRLIAGAMPEASSLGIVIFLLNNQSYGIVKHVMNIMMTDVHPEHHHTDLVNVDYVKAAKACNWDAAYLKPDLSNLEGLIRKAYRTKKSLLIEVPSEPHQSLGFNPRAMLIKYSQKPE